MKYDWKKSEKELYNVKGKPILVNVPKQHFITISGTGNPNDSLFSEKVSALFSVAYGIKMTYKRQPFFEEITDYTVYPLEGKWSKTGDELIKDNLIYTIMIQQPSFITEDFFQSIIKSLKIKKPNDLYDDISFETMSDGKTVQILHKGAYDSEPLSFEKMENFLKEHHLQRTTDWHREIYLNNYNRTKPENLKTILRYCVK